jgi:hypothetical protein
MNWVIYASINTSITIEHLSIAIIKEYGIINYKVP